MDVHISTLLPMLSELIRDRLHTGKLEASLNTLTALVRATGVVTSSPILPPLFSFTSAITASYFHYSYFSSHSTHHQAMSSSQLHPIPHYCHHSSLLCLSKSLPRLRKRSVLSKQWASGVLKDASDSHHFFRPSFQNIFIASQTYGALALN